MESGLMHLIHAYMHVHSSTAAFVPCVSRLEAKREHHSRNWVPLCRCRKSNPAAIGGTLASLRTSTPAKQAPCPLLSTLRDSFDCSAHHCAGGCFGWMGWVGIRCMARVLALAVCAVCMHLAWHAARTPHTVHTHCRSPHTTIRTHRVVTHCRKVHRYWWWAAWARRGHRVTRDCGGGACVRVCSGAACVGSNPSHAADLLVDSVKTAFGSFKTPCTSGISRFPTPPGACWPALAAARPGSNFA